MIGIWICLNAPTLLDELQNGREQKAQASTINGDGKRMQELDIQNAEGKTGTKLMGNEWKKDELGEGHYSDSLTSPIGKRAFGDWRWWRSPLDDVRECGCHPFVPFLLLDGFLGRRAKNKRTNRAAL
jgi:hypothetical protein